MAKVHYSEFILPLPLICNLHDMNNADLIVQAKAIAVLKDSENGCVSGSVGAVVLTASGKIYKGVSIDCACGIGFCVEHSAIAAMLTAGEADIASVIAVNSLGKIYPPCGRCRELMFQISRNNLTTRIILSNTDTITLNELLPMPWQESI